MPKLQNRQDLLWELSFLGILLFLFSPAIYHNFQLMYETNIGLDDALQYIPAFYSYLPESIPKNYFDEYYLNAIIPIGYKVLFINAAQHVDLVILSKHLIYIPLFITIIILALCVKELTGSSLLAICTVMFALAYSAQAMLLLGFYGGTPRSFAFPIMALGLLYIIKGRPVALGIITIASTIIYPIAGVILGFTMALILILPEKYHTASKGWSFKKRIGFIFAVMTLSAAILIPQMMLSTDHGSLIAPGALEAFPEADEDGRYAIGYRMLDSLDIGFLVSYFKKSFLANGTLILGLYDTIYEKTKINFFALSIFIVQGFIFLSIIMGFQKITQKGNEAVVRMFLLLAASFILFVTAYFLQPYMYMPSRYLMYSIPILATILFPVSVVRWAMNLKFVKGKEQRAKRFAAIVVLSVIIIAGGKGYTQNDEPTKYDIDETNFLHAISNLPTNALVAGWPNDTAVRKTKIQTKRNILISRDIHQALHEKNTLHARDITNDLIKAYFATERKHIELLKTKYNVTHILIKTEHYGKEPPKYFAPFDEKIELIHEQQRQKAILLGIEKLEDASILRNASGTGYILYDINKLLDLI